jgi:hypothetical protein
VVSRTALALAAVATTAWSWPAAADEANLTLSDGYIRTIIPARPAAGYFTLTNNGDAVVSLVGAASPGCGSVMLHQSRSQNGVETMVPVASVDVPPHGSVSFAPGGYHLMCMAPAATLKPGASVPMTLRFADGGTLTGDFPVRGATGQ